MAVQMILEEAGLIQYYIKVSLVIPLSQDHYFSMPMIDQIIFLLKAVQF